MKKANNRINSLIKAEQLRQKNEISLIASENYVSKAILEATGSVLTNKYAEGYPARRYYAGCSHVDEIEKLAIQSCMTLFNSDHANVQAHSGSQANLAVYLASLNPGDTILSMSMQAGGHLSHGYQQHASSKLFKTVFYGVDSSTHQINYNMIADQAYKHKPRLIIAGASSYSRIIDFTLFSKIAKEVNALLMVDMAHIAGLVATGLHPNPVPYADFVTSTTHKTLRGPRGGFILCKKQYASQLDKSIMPGMQGGPLMHAIAAKGIAFEEARQQPFRNYQQDVLSNAHVMANEFIKNGHTVISGGTDTHQFTIDVSPYGLTGKDVESKLQSVGITVNRNCIPFDTQSPWVTSGIRIGTAAITTRGMTSDASIELVCLIDQVIKRNPSSTIKNAVLELAKKYPPPY